MEQNIRITIDWPWLLGIFGTILMVTWFTATKFSRIETLLESLNNRLSNIEISIKEFQSGKLK